MNKKLNINFLNTSFFTVEESSKLKSDLNMQGAHTKNLFLRDKRNFYLLSCLDSTEVDLKIIKNTIQCQKLSFGSAEYLYDKLGVKPGSVSPTL